MPFGTNADRPMVQGLAALNTAFIYFTPAYCYVNVDGILRNVFMLPYVQICGKIHFEVMIIKQQQQQQAQQQQQ